MKFSRKEIIYIASIASGVLAAFIIGIVVGNVSKKVKKTENLNENYKLLIDDSENENYKNRIINDIHGSNIEETLKLLSAKPRLAGTPGETDSAKYIYDTWKSQGFDNVEMIGYDVLLAYPDENIKNNVKILSENRQVIKTVEIIEPNYDLRDDKNGTTDFLHVFTAYSANGTVTSNEVYYANYGTEADFQLLASKANLTGKIVLCKFGRLFRGDKVVNAERYGVAGVLLFDDPDRSAANGAATYPNGMFLPEEGAQWGSLYNIAGDPLTPLYPSIENGYRENHEDVKGLTKVVVQAIGYKLAKEILALIRSNESVPEDWRGDLNVNYTFGGRLINNRSLSLTVYSNLKIAKTYNVIGVLKGSVEPDRYVIIGAHRDTWSYGAVDDTSGTSILLEIARAMSSIKNITDWRPRRSILFCSWGAEEYSLIGSTEWVEEFTKKLSANGIVYMNLDPGVKGNFTFEAESSPLFFDLIYDVAKKFYIKNDETVFERWLKSDPNNDKTRPIIRAFSGGGDNMAFMQRVGLPIIDSTLTKDKSDPRYKKLGFSYPIYHTSYETYNYIKRFIDPTFQLHELLARIQTKLLLDVATSIILPFNTISYALQLQEVYQSFYAQYGSILARQNITLSHLQDNIDSFLHTTNRYHLVRQYNEQLRNLEKAFIDPLLSFKRRGYQHVIFSPSLGNSYGGFNFPALSEAIADALNESTNERWNEVRKQLNLVILGIQSAISILNEPEMFRTTQI